VSAPIYLVPVLAAVLFLAMVAGFCWLTREPRARRVPLARLADPAPLPGEIFPEVQGVILWSEQQAALDAHEREVAHLIAEAEWRIGRVMW
jgi:hypothetical protein